MYIHITQENGTNACTVHVYIHVHDRERDIRIYVDIYINYKYIHKVNIKRKKEKEEISRDHVENHGARKAENAEKKRWGKKRESCFSRLNFQSSSSSSSSCQRWFTTKTDEERKRERDQSKGREGRERTREGDDR